MLSLDTTVQILWFGTPLAAFVSGVSVLTAFSGDSWLSTVERMPNPSYRNGSSKIEFLSKMTTSGLFTLCATEVGSTEYHCTRIDYFPNEEYRPDLNDSTSAIPYTVLKSVGLFLTAAVLLSMAEVICFLGHCCDRRRFLTFTGGVIFIVSGLFMLLGVVMYIATLKGEVAEKLRAKSAFQPPLFSYTYGWCFLLMMFAFISTEIAGISAIFLYIYRYKRDWIKKEEHRFLADPAMEPPSPPCLKHPVGASGSVPHTLIEGDVPPEGGKRSQSHQYLEYSPQNQKPKETRHHNHINHISQLPHNHINVPHRLQNHVPNAPRHDHTHNSRSHHHHQQPNKYYHHNQRHLPESHNPEWNFSGAREIRFHETLPRSGRSLNDLQREEWSEEPLIPGGGTLPRSISKGSGSILRGSGTLPRANTRDVECNRAWSGSAGTLPRSFPRSNTVMFNSLPRTNRNISRSGPLYPERSVRTDMSGMCTMGAECYQCCACYCCCCCWQETGQPSTSTVTTTPYNFPPARRLSQAPATVSRSRNSVTWRDNLTDDHDPLLPRDLTCTSICTSTDLSTSSSSLHRQQQKQQTTLQYPPPRHPQYSPHPPRPPPPQHSQYPPPRHLQPSSPHPSHQYLSPHHSTPHYQFSTLGFDHYLDRQHEESHRHTTPV